MDPDDLLASITIGEFYSRRKDTRDLWYQRPGHKAVV